MNKQRRSLVTKLGILTISSFMVLFLIYNIINNSLSYEANQTTGEEIVTITTEKTALQIEEQFNQTISSLEREADTLLALIQQGQLSSDFLIDYKKRALERDKTALGYSIILKADLINDLNPAHAQFIDSQGYFAPYIVKSGNDIIVEQIEDATEGIWYTSVESTNQLAITDPYEFDVDGQSTLMMTTSLPIMVENTLVGVTVTDFSLDFLNPIIESNIPASAIQRIATPSGLILTDSGNVDNINSSLEKFVPDWNAVHTTLQQGENTDFYADSVTFGEQAYAAFIPIKIQDLNEHFIVQTFMPKSVILASFYKTLRISLYAALVIAIVLGFVTYFFINKGLKPLQQVNKALTKAANGQLTEVISATQLPNDEIGAVGRAYNTMRHKMSDVIDHVVQNANHLEATSTTTNRSIEEISQSSADMSKAIQEIATGSQIQATEIDTANTEMSLLSSKMDVLADTANTMQDYVLQSNSQAQKGKSQILQLHKQSIVTSEGNAELELQMSKLATQIGQINSVMSSIQGITEQTNLLALNASIEAARAGEYGKGFAVVADEVRKLAEQSKNETEHVQQIVSNILRESEQTKTLASHNTAIFKEQLETVSNTEQAFTAQLSYAEQIETQIHELLSELNQMMQEKERVLASMQSIASISEQSAASAEEIAASTQEQANEIAKIVPLMNNLHDIASDLKENTSFFTVKH